MPSACNSVKVINALLNQGHDNLTLKMGGLTSLLVVVLQNHHQLLCSRRLVILANLILKLILHSPMNLSLMATLTVIFWMVFPSARSHLTGVKLGLLQLDVQRCTILFPKEWFSCFDNSLL